MNFYKRYPGDYMRDTGHLSVIEHGAYSLLLDQYYATERPLPTGKALYRLLRADTAAERKAVDNVLKQFFEQEGGGWIQSRAKAEIEKAEKRRETNRKNGTRGGRPREDDDAS